MKDQDRNRWKEIEWTLIRKIGKILFFRNLERNQFVKQLQGGREIEEKERKSQKDLIFFIYKNCKKEKNYGEMSRKKESNKERKQNKRQEFFFSLIWQIYGITNQIPNQPTRFFFFYARKQKGTK